MWTFQYKHGDRPLDGYTIQRAAGRGGFGEVYYAVSDSGREVALKVISGYEQIELRGISQCMNLKSPHLVTIFDVRQNPEGRWFVIMEFVSGANLRQLLDEAPAGLGTQKTAFFLREIAKGLTFLHECGIVHRDLKPANIFYENGYVKIGDYGLSKAIAPDQHSGQTVTVGTVHYMAPEIGAGKYDRSVDIYALGALVYEMLTGTVPHVGASATEVLMKHLSAEPDYTNIPEPFGKVVRKAMAKDPALRYQSVQEMVEDVFGAEHIRQSVSVFSPQDLSMIAEHAAKRIGGGAGGGGVGVATGSSAATREPAGAQPGARRRMGNVFDDVFNKVFEASGFGQADPDAPTHAPGAAAAGPAVLPVRDIDPLSSGQRRTLAALLSIVAAVVGAVLGDRMVGGEGALFFIFPCVWGISVGSLLAARRVLPAMRHESMLVRRLVVGLFAGGLAFLFTLPYFGIMGGRNFQSPHSYGELYLSVILAIVVVWLILPIERILMTNRRHRLNLGIATAACILAVVFGGMFGSRDEVASVAGTCAAAAMLMLQMLATWHPREALMQRNEYNSIKTATARHKWADQFRRVGDDARDAISKVRDEFVAGRTPGQAPQAPAIPATPMMQWGATTPRTATTSSPIQYWWRPVGGLARSMWGILMILTFAASIAFWVAAGFSRNGSDLGAFTTLGFAVMFVSIVALVRACTTRFYGWWGYFIKPLLLIACGTGCVAMIALMATSAHLNGTEMAFAWFFLVLFFGAAIVLLCVPGRYRLATSPPPIPGTNPSSAPATNLDWHGTPPIEAARAHYGGTFFGIVSGMFLLPMLVVGLIYAIDIPALIASGLPDRSLAMHLQRDVFGTSQWPAFVQQLICTSVVIMMLGAMSFLTLARRRCGGLHILRGIVALLTLFFSIMLVRAGFSSRIWTELAGQGNVPPGQVLMTFMNRVSYGAAIFSAIVFMFGVMLIAWPAARPASIVPAKKRSGWAIAGIAVAVFVISAMFLGLFISVATPTVHIQGTSPTIVPMSPMQPMQSVESFRGQQWQFQYGPTTLPQSGGAFGGGGSMVGSSSKKGSTPNIKKTPTTAPNKIPPQFVAPPGPSLSKPSGQRTPTTVPDGIFEE